jgi:hypothetical protein
MSLFLLWSPFSKWPYYNYVNLVLFIPRAIFQILQRQFSFGPSCAFSTLVRVLYLHFIVVASVPATDSSIPRDLLLLATHDPCAFVCLRCSGRALDLSDNAFEGPFPEWLLTQPQAAEAACQCNLSLAVNGPDTSLTCPASLRGASAAQLAALEQYEFECTRDGQTVSLTGLTSMTCVFWLDLNMPRRSSYSKMFKGMALKVWVCVEHCLALWIQSVVSRSLWQPQQVPLQMPVLSRQILYAQQLGRGTN